MYKSTHKATDYINRVADFSTHGSRRGFTDLATEGFDESMNTDRSQALATFRRAISRCVGKRRALEVLWFGKIMNKNQRMAYNQRASRKPSYCPPSGEKYLFDEWRRLGVIQRKLADERDRIWNSEQGKRT